MNVGAAQFGRFSGRMPDTMGLAAVLALAALALEPIVGTLAALAFLLSGLFLMAHRPGEAIVDLADARLIMVLPVYCMASALWSEAPAASLRSGVQLTLTFVFAVLVARRLPPGRFLIGVVGVLSVIVALSMTTGSYRADTGALTGFFSSKNAMGSAAALLAVMAAGMIGATGATRLVRAGAMLGLLIGAGGVVLAQSIGALVAMGIGLATYPVLAVLRRLSLRLQVVASVACALMAGLLVVLLTANLDAVAAFVLSATGKDLTLTGRTDLWRIALDEIAERPLLGQGFQAFWRVGNPAAEDLWRMFGIETRSGFHFHNLYLSNAVEIGILGAAMQAALLVWLCVASLRLALATRDARAATLLAVSVMVLSITPLEVPAFFAFSLQTFILVAGLVYVRDGLAVLAAAPVSGSGRSRSRG